MNAEAPPDHIAPERIRLHRADGTSFALLLFPAGDPHAPAILVEPAMGVKAGYYRPLAQALLEAGCNVAVAELRGHEEGGGRKPGWSYDFGYHHMLTEDWPLAVQAVQARFPEAPFYLLGHSLGGQISSLYAAHHPEQLAGLMLIAVSSVHWRLWSWPFLLYSQLTVPVSHLVGHFPGRYFRFAGREARSVIRDWARQARTGRFYFGKPRIDHDAKLRTLAIPVLAISLEGDFFAPRKAMDGILNKFPKAQLTRHHLGPKAMGFEGIDHFRWVRRPQVVLPAITEWLALRRRHARA
ncbi:MAG TPA: alpha/beta fold hydrolase [Ferrovibrio sp.]|uniref:alpha/beta hydrolase family protein n=1 Tax=Ferrovibrio sp. TaxID=1917215 RepID=UPI002ED0C13C